MQTAAVRFIKENACDRGRDMPPWHLFLAYLNQIISIMNGHITFVIVCGIWRPFVDLNWLPMKLPSSMVSRNQSDQIRYKSDQIRKHMLYPELHPTMYKGMSLRCPFKSSAIIKPCALFKGQISRQYLSRQIWAAPDLCCICTVGCGSWLGIYGLSCLYYFALCTS